MEGQIFEKDWERFDGFTPTFRHPSLNELELPFLLAAAYTRFYFRPSFLANYYRFQRQWVIDLVKGLDRRVSALHSRNERAVMSRIVEC
jgi:hypothetical protein